MSFIELHQPMMITARLLPGVRVGDNSYISVKHVGYTDDNRERWEYHIDTPDWEFSANDFASGVRGKMDPEEVVEALISFLCAAAERYRYDMLSKPVYIHEEDHLFPLHVTEWAYMNDSELQSLQCDLQPE